MFFNINLATLASYIFALGSISIEVIHFFTQKLASLGFTGEFMQEIEIPLIGDREMREVDINNYFTSVNSKKEE